MPSVAEPLKLELIAPPMPVQRFTVEQYQRLAEAGVLAEDAQVELLEGWIVPMPLRKPRHNSAIDRVGGEFTPVLPPQYFLRVQMPIVCNGSQPEPDIAVVRGPRGRYDDRHPTARDIAMLVESAEASLAQDRGLKARIYARAKIPAYWILNLVEDQIEVLSNPTGPGVEPRFRSKTVYGPSDSVPLVIRGAEVARIPVRKLLPRRGGR